MYDYNFSYGSLLIAYNPEINTYKVTDINYGITLGVIECENGPGWILDISSFAVFLDVSQAELIAELLSALNETLSETHA